MMMKFDDGGGGVVGGDNNPQHTKALPQRPQSVCLITATARGGGLVAVQARHRLARRLGCRDDAVEAGIKLALLMKKEKKRKKEMNKEHELAG